MQNWIAAVVWIAMGGAIGLGMKAVVKLPDGAARGHTAVIFTLGAFAAVIGGMLGVGIFEFDDPRGLTAGGLGAGAVFAALMTALYRWSIRELT